MMGKARLHAAGDEVVNYDRSTGWHFYQGSAGLTDILPAPRGDRPIS